MPQASQAARGCHRDSKVQNSEHLWGHSIFGYILGVVLQLLHLILQSSATREAPQLPNLPTSQLPGPVL